MQKRQTKEKGKGAQSAAKSTATRTSPRKGAKAAPPPASQNAAKSLHDDVTAELDAIGSNCEEEAQEESVSRRTESDEDGTGANERVPASAAERHRENEVHGAMRRIAELEARIQVRNVETLSTVNLANILLQKAPATPSTAPSSTSKRRKTGTRAASPVLALPRVVPAGVRPYAVCQKEG